MKSRVNGLDSVAGSARRFIDDEAEVDGTDDEEEDSEEDLEDFVVDDSHSVSDGQCVIRNADNESTLFGHEKLSSLFHFDDSDDDHSISENLKRTASAIVDRARKRRLLSCPGTQGQMVDMDTEPDAVMYIVRCKRGREKLAATQLAYSHTLDMKKVDSASTLSSSSIYDIFILPFSAGRLYVVADSLTTVKNACMREQGPANKISYTYSSFKLVPPTEARRVKLIRDGVKTLRRRKMRGTWVKIINHSLYKGDFGIVLDIEGEDGGVVHTASFDEFLDVLVVSRVVFRRRVHGTPIRNYDDVQIESVPYEKRPRPNFFTYDDALLRFGGAAIKLEAFDMFSIAGQRFYSGMHVITVNRSDVDENSKPTALNVQIFMQIGTRDLDIINRAFLRVHDKVRVTEGEYLSYVGRVLRRETDSVIIFAFGDDGQGREIELSFGQCERVFGVNDWVRVMLGEHRDAVGVVTTVSEEELTIACHCKEDPADVLKVRDPHLTFGTKDKGKDAPTYPSNEEQCLADTKASDVPKPQHVKVLTLHQSYVETFEVSVSIHRPAKKYDESERYAKHQPVYIVSGPLKGVAELMYCNGKEAMVFCPDGRGYQVTSPDKVVLSTTWRTGTDRALDRVMLRKAKERIRKYEAEGPPSFMNFRLPLLDTRINQSALIVKGPMKGCVGDLLSVGNKYAMIYIDAKSEHVQQVNVKYVISSADWKFLDGRNVDANSVPVLMKTLADHSGTNLVLGLRANTPPLESAKEGGPSYTNGLSETGLHNVTVYGLPTDVRSKNPRQTGAMWAFHPVIKTLMSTYHVCFRLKNSFFVPSDRGMMAWSLSEPKIIKEVVAGHEVEVYGVPVRYKPRSGDHARDQFVDVRHLKECVPLLKSEAVRVRGDKEKIGQIVYVHSWPDIDDSEEDGEEKVKGPKPKGKEIRVRPGGSSARGAKYFMLSVDHVTLIKPYGSL